MRLSFCLKHWSEMYWNAYKFVLKCVNKNFLYIAVEVGNWNIKKTKIIWDSNLVRIFSWWKREVKMNCEWITKILSSVSNRVSAENRGDHRNRKIEIEPLDGKTYLSIQLSRGEFGHVAMKKKTYSLTDSLEENKRKKSRVSDESDCKECTAFRHFVLSMDTRSCLLLYLFGFHIFTFFFLCLSLSAFFDLT